MIDGEERQVVDANPASVVVIDTRPIGTVEFNLRPIEKEFLLKIGRASALTFLRSRKLDDGPDDETVESASREAEKCRNAVQRMRKWRRVRRICAVLLLFGAGYLIAPIAWHALALAWETLRKFV